MNTACHNTRRSVLWLIVLFAGGLAFGACGDDPPPVEVECTTSEDCAAGEECSAAGVCETRKKACVTDQDCASSQECSADKVCVDRATQVDCVKKADCSWNEVCTAAGACKLDPFAPQCQDSDHCTETEFCDEGGVCVTRECETADDCEDYQWCNGAFVCVDNPEEPVARRIDSLTLLSPNFNVPEVAVCTPLTEVINGLLTTMVNEVDEDGNYELALVLEQVDKVSNTQTGRLHLSTPECREGTPDSEVVDPPVPADICIMDETKRVSSVRLDKRATDGVCFARVPATANADGFFNVPENTIDPSDIPTADAPDPEVVDATANGCFSTTVDEPLVLDLNGIVLTLNHYSTAAQYTLPIVGGYEVGIIQGFVTAAEAKATILPESLPLVGGQPLSSLMANGFKGCIDALRGLDKGPDAAGDLVDGWWVQIGYTARIVDMEEPPIGI